VLLVRCSLDGHYQPELGVLWEANPAATQQLKGAIIAVLCVLLLQGSVNFLCSILEFRFGWGGLALSLSFHIPVFLVKA